MVSLRYRKLVFSIPIIGLLISFVNSFRKFIFRKLFSYFLRDPTEKYFCFVPLPTNHRNRFFLKTSFHLYPVLPQKLHRNVQQSHTCEKFLFFSRFSAECSLSFCRFYSKQSLFKHKKRAAHSGLPSSSNETESNDINPKYKYSHFFCRLSSFPDRCHSTGQHQSHPPTG